MFLIQLLTSLILYYVYMYICTFMSILMRRRMRCMYRKIICEQYRITASPLSAITAFSPYADMLATNIRATGYSLEAFVRDSVLHFNFFPLFAVWMSLHSSTKCFCILLRVTELQLQSHSCALFAVT